jgi:hypothetical protein
MVRMFVGVKHTVDDPDSFSKQLVPKIGRGIDEKITPGKTKDRAAAGPVIPRILAFADRAPAPDGRDADAGTGSQKDHFTWKLDALAGESHGSRRWFKGKSRSSNGRDNASQTELRRLSSISSEFATPVFSQFNSCFRDHLAVDWKSTTFVGPSYLHGVPPRGHYNIRE